MFEQRKWYRYQRNNNSQEPHLSYHSECPGKNVKHIGNRYYEHYKLE